jgi:hypothetical protein
MFRAGLLLNMRINSVKTAIGTVLRYVDWLLPIAIYRELILLMSSKPARNM